MRFVAKYIAESHRNGSLPRSDDYVTVQNFTTGGNSRSEQLTMRLGVNVMRAARWMSGDRVTICFGESNGKMAFMLKRSQTGYTLSSGKKKKGECVTCNVKCSMSGDMKQFAANFVGKRFVPSVDGNEVFATIEDEVLA